MWKVIDTKCYKTQMNLVFFFGTTLNLFNFANGISLPKLFWPTVRKNCSSDWEKLLKFEAKDPEFAKNFRSNSLIYVSRTIRIQVGKNNWGLETYRKNYKNT